MEAKLDSNYKQLLVQAQQLSEEKLKKLILTLQSELELKRKNSNKNIKQLILEAPEWSEEQIKKYYEGRTAINSSRLG